MNRRWAIRLTGTVKTGMFNDTETAKMALTESDREFINVAIAARNGELLEKFAEMIRSHETGCGLRTDVDELCQVMYGNGKPGIKMDVHDLKQDLASIQRARSGARQFFTTVGTGVITGVLVAVILVWVGVRAMPRPVPGQLTDPPASEAAP
jgi:hypothetical protein